MFQTYQTVFAERAASYQAAMARWPDARAAEFQALIAPLGDLGDSIVCDLPAGGGYLRRYLPATTRYIAVEPAAVFFAACPKGEGSTALLAPIEAVPLPAGSVDHVVSLGSLHHVASLADVFSEMRRLLRPGGRVVACDVAVGSTAAAFLNGFVDRHNPMGHEGVFLDETAAPTLAAAGFAIVADDAVVTPWRFADRGQAGAFCAGLFGTVGLQADDVAGALDAEIGFDPSSGGVTLRWPLRRIVGAAC